MSRPLDSMTLVVSTHGCKSAALPQPYFVGVFVFCAGHVPPLHLPAVVDDFGNLVIVGGAL